MKERVCDMFTCLKMSFGIYLIPVILGLIIGVIKGVDGAGYDKIIILNWIYTVGVSVSCIGLLISSVTFFKGGISIDVEYQKKWKTYFKKFNITTVVIWICIFMLIFSNVLDVVKRNLMY